MTQDLVKEFPTVARIAERHLTGETYGFQQQDLINEAVQLYWRLRAALPADWVMVPRETACGFIPVPVRDVQKLKRLTSFNTSALAAHLSQMADQWLNDAPAAVFGSTDVELDNLTLRPVAAAPTAGRKEGE